MSAKQSTKAAPVAREVKANQNIQMIRREALQPDPNQPRKTFAPGPLQELADSIVENGIIQPLIVEAFPAPFTLHEPDLIDKENWVLLDASLKEAFRGSRNHCLVNAGGEVGLKPFFQIAAGERRWRASGLAKLDLVPCLVRPPLTAKERYCLQHAENKDREGLTPMDEAESFYQAVYTNKLYSAEQLAKDLGMSRTYVFARLKLAQLPKAVKEAVAAGTLNAALAELVAKIPGEKNQVKCMKEVLEGGTSEWNEESRERILLPMSVRTAKRHIQQNYMLDLEDAAFPVKSVELYPPAGACAACPKRSGNCTELYPELAKTPNVCTDPECYKRKVEMFAAANRERAEKEGKVIVSAEETKKLFRYNNELPGNLLKDLNVPYQEDKKKRTFEQIFGKDAPKPVVAIAPDGSSHEYYQLEMLRAALEQKGFSFAKKEREGDTEETAEEARKRVMAARLDRAQRTEIGLALIAEAGKPLKPGKSEHVFWCRLLDLIAIVSSDSGGEWESPFTRRGLGMHANEWGKVDVGVLREMAVEILIQGNSFDDELNFAQSVEQWAVRWGVDVKCIKKMASAEFKKANRLPKHQEEIKVDREWLDGPVAESGSTGMLMSEGKIRQPFEWRGYLWVEGGSCSSGNEGTINRQIWRVVPAAEYKEGTLTSREKLAFWDKNEPCRGDFEGMLVTCGNEKFVLVKPEVTLLPDKPLDKAKAKKKK